MTNPHDLPFAVEFAGLATAGAGGYVASRHPAIMPLAVLDVSVPRTAINARPSRRAWYKRHLGIAVHAWGGAAFEWTDAEGKAVAGTTTWCINPHESDSVAPSAASFMVNSRVEDRRALVAGTATTRRERHRVAVLSMAGTRRGVGLEPCVDRAACHGSAARTSWRWAHVIGTFPSPSDGLLFRRARLVFLTHGCRMARTDAFRLTVDRGASSFTMHSSDTTSVRYLSHRTFSTGVRR